MSETTKQLIARRVYSAFESGNRDALEALISDDFEFFAPPDPGIGRERYFERCWPGHEHLHSFELVRLIESGDEVLVTYEATRTDGSRFRNTEVLTFRGEQMVKAEVYFGWNLD